ncbi:MAG: SMP-30/gluconolactonase/LRE family protein [Thermoleophilia bacterium]|nr:SMP-30/gluconolactonase/LRE family protein [Thermoleophilia bacterium]
MAAVDSLVTAARLPGPPELLPGRPDAIVDLQTDEGMALVRGQWRYEDCLVEKVEFLELGSEADPLGPGTVPNSTYHVIPHAEAPDFEDSDWRVLQPEETMLRLGNGRVCFSWYRTSVTIPERIGELDPTGATVVFEVVIDDYAEVWVDGRLPLALGQTGGQVAAGFNAPNRVVLTRDARPGDTFQVAVFGINGPISAAPANYIWMRSATLDVYAGERARVGEPVELEVERLDPALDRALPEEATLERVAGGFEFTEGPVWTRDGALLFSSPNTNAIYRWAPEGAVTVFRPKSGYTGVDVGRYHQPGSNGLTFSPDGLLTLCQHGNRRVLRVNPHGDTTVLADRYEGKRLNSPNDLVYRSDGTLYFTDPPFGLPGVFDDPAKELDFSGVFFVRGGEVRLGTDELAGPNGLAFSPDERFLYVGNWDPEWKVVMRYEVAADGALSGGVVLADLTGEDGEDAIDGIKVDEAGNLYVCGPGGIWMLAPDGTRLGLLRLPEAPHNLAFGDADGRTLYVTALTGVYRLRLEIPGIRPT